MVFYNKSKFYQSKTIIAQCDCGTHHVEINKLDDEDQYYLIIYKEPKTLKYRLKQCFEVLFKNRNVREELILGKEDFNNLTKYLKEMKK
jgi:hypothetical protein